GPGAFEGEHGFHDDGLFVDGALGGGDLDHGVLAADVIDGERTAGVCADVGYNVQVNRGRLDHQDVRAFVFILQGFGQRLATVGLVHLVAVAGALEVNVHRIPEGTVKGGCEFGGVGHDGDL